MISRKEKFFFSEKGVSLIEMLLVVALIVILSAITLPIQSRVLTSNALSDGVSDIATALRTANLQAKLASNGLPAGVYFEETEDGQNKIISYRGSSYEERNPDLDLIVEIPGGLKITVSPDRDVHFAILSSENEHDTIIKVENSSGLRQIRVNTAGAILEEMPDSNESSETE